MDQALLPTTFEGRCWRLAEEAGEVTKVLSKLHRFGPWSTWGGRNNVEMLLDEITDLRHALDAVEGDVRQMIAKELADGDYGLDDGAPAGTGSGAGGPVGVLGREAARHPVVPRPDRRDCGLTRSWEARGERAPLQRPASREPGRDPSCAAPRNRRRSGLLRAALGLVAGFRP